MNPYWKVTQKELRRTSRPWVNGLLLVVALILAPFSQPALLHFLDHPNPILGLEGLAFRLSALVGAAVSLASYQQIIRTEERGVLGVHPIQPQLWFSALFRKTIISTWTWPFIASGLAWPLLQHNLIQEYVLLSIIVCIGWGAMLCVSYAVHLGSVAAARSPKMAPLLDGIRGNNPREQAAFIYAPGFALFFCGLAMMLCSFSMDGVLLGYPPAIAMFSLPVLLGAGSFFLARGLSRSQLVPASAVLAEVDARWAALDEGGEENGVYLEWLANDRRELLRALRQGWRTLRIWPMGIWGMGAFAFVSAWSGDLKNALLFSSIGSVGGCTIAVVLAKKNPVWLDEHLGVQSMELLLARFWVCFLYAQGAILPLLVLGWKSVFVRILILEGCVVLSSVLSAYLSVYHRKNGVFLFLPIALIVMFLGLI